MNPTITRFLKLCIGILCLVALPLRAQQNNSLYFMTGLPQSNQLNPATQPKCGFFLTFPSIEFTTGNSSLGVHDLLFYEPTLDSTVWFMHNKKTRGDFLNKISGNVNLFSETRLDLFSIGLRVRNTYVTLGVGARLESNNYLPSDLIRFAVEGNIDTVGGTLKSFNFSGLGVNAMYYNEYALGISHEFNKKLTVGVKGKLLFGIANVTTNSSDVSMNGGTLGAYQMHSVVNLNTSIPNLTVYSGADGQVDSTDFKSIKNASEARSILMNTKNMGLAMDIGVIYKPIEKLSLSFSVLDLGYIKWKDNVNNFTQNTVYDFKGVNILIRDSADMGKALMDTLKNNFKYNSEVSAYTTNLSPKLYVGALFQLTKGIAFGALTRQQLINKKLNSQYTFSLNLYPANAINFTVSYTIADHMYDNFGFGMSAKLLCFQTYFMSERIPLAWGKDEAKGIPYPAYAKSINFRAGINFVFGYRHREKKLRGDKPLVDL